MSFCVQTGLTSLSIAQRLGYISVVELLKNITEVAMSPLTMEERYKVLAPEIMQEAAMSDSEEEGGIFLYFFRALTSLLCPDLRMVGHHKARFPLPELTARVNGPS